MLRIRQTFGVHAGRVLELDQAVVRIGRLPSSDVAFDPKVDLDASGRHAEIRKTDQGYDLVDVGSRNGTLVNGVLIQEARLKSGDEIECGVGGPRLTVEIVEPQEGSSVEVAIPVPAKSAGADDPDSATIALERPSMRVMQRDPPPPSADASVSVSPAARFPLWLWLTLILVVLALLGMWLALRYAQDTGSTSVDIRGGITVADVGAMTAKEIETQFRRALYALVEKTALGEERVVCTAFAVRPALLATAAHCLVAIEKAAQNGSKFQATSCDKDTTHQAAIVRMWRHPGFKMSGIEPMADVALVQLDRGVLDQVALAGIQHLESLSKDERLWLFGITGQAARKNCYAAQVYATKVERISGLSSTRANALPTIEYGAVLPPTAGGSPVFNTAGLVVGVHSATLGALMTGIHASERPTAGYTYGVRADVLLELLLGIEASN